MRIASVGSAFPPHRYDQETLLAEAKRVLGARLSNSSRLDKFYRNTQVHSRYLALAMEEYEHLDGWGQANDAWIRVATEIGEAAVRNALAGTKLPAESISAFFTTSITGIAAPSLDARLLGRLGLPASVKRVPIFGLGCVAGAAGIARAADYVKAFPEEAAILLSVELCSLTFQRDDMSVRNLISTGLFGDGAAAAVVAGDGLAEGPRIVDTRSTFYPDTEDVMGWDISERGFRIVLSATVPDVVRDNLRQDVDGFLGNHGLERADIETWIAHTGGPRVLKAIEECLELPDDALALTWKSLNEVGNISSTSVLLVLEETMRTRQPAAGSFGMMLAMGPGFCSELVLLQW